MEPEVKDLLIIASLALLFIVITVRYFLIRAAKQGGDKLIALRNSLFVALLLFVIFILFYESQREKRVVDTPDPNWCEKNPQKCATPPALPR